jgi:hypothetical protein
MSRGPVSLAIISAASKRRASGERAWYSPRSK